MKAGRLVLTGARGLVGDAVLRHFHGLGWQITVACSGAVHSTAGNIDVLPFDLGAVHANSALENAVSQADAVIHCAAVMPSSGLLKTPEGARELYRKNSQGTFELMQMAAQRGTGRFVFISGASLYARPPALVTEDIPLSPPDAYLLSKQAGETIAGLFDRSSKASFFSLRVSAPYGAHFSAKAVIPTFVSQALAGLPLQLMGSGNREQVFTYVADVARACEAAVKAEAPSGPYNIAGPAPVSMAQLATAVVKATGGNAEVTFTGEPDPNEGAKRRISLARAKEYLGWEPLYDIDRGLAEMVAELRNPPAHLLAAF